VRDGSAGLSQHRPAGAGGTAATRARAGRAGGEPGRGGPGGGRAAADGQPLAQALPHAGRRRGARWSPGVAATRQRGTCDRGGQPGPALDRRQAARSAEAAVRALDGTRGAGADRTPLGQAPRPVDRPAVPPALGPEPAETLGPARGSDHRRSLPGWRATIPRLPGAPRPSVPRSTGATRPGSRTRTRSAARGHSKAARPWSPGPPSGSARD
jgi:hypothetical protein